MARKQETKGKDEAIDPKARKTEIDDINETHVCRRCGDRHNRIAERCGSLVLQVCLSVVPLGSDSA